MVKKCPFLHKGYLSLYLLWFSTKRRHKSTKICSFSCILHRETANLFCQTESALSGQHNLHCSTKMPLPPPSFDVYFVKKSVDHWLWDFLPWAFSWFSKRWVLRIITILKSLCCKLLSYCSPFDGTLFQGFYYSFCYCIKIFNLYLPGLRNSPSKVTSQIFVSIASKSRKTFWPVNYPLWLQPQVLNSHPWSIFQHQLI